MYNVSPKQFKHTLQGLVIIRSAFHLLVIMGNKPHACSPTIQLLTQNTIEGQISIIHDMESN